METESGKIRVLIADDHSVVREGTRQILEREPDIAVVGEAADGDEAVQMAKAMKPNLILMDVSMPKLDGIEATKLIKAHDPCVPVLILSAYDDDQFVFSLLEAGAAGYLLKTMRSNELVDAVRAVHAGESVLHPSIAKKVVERFHGPKQAVSKQPPHTLSDRELEVLKLAARGLSNKEIADQLCLSMRTVQGHLGHIFNKLGLSSRTEAVVRGLKEGWITIDDAP